MIAALVFCLSPWVQAASFKEGTHYEVVNSQASASPEVVEFFSYYCPACKNFEAAAAQIEQNLPDNVAFKKNHVKFLGDYGAELVRAYAVAKSLKVEEEFSQVVFSMLGGHGLPIKSEDDLRKIFLSIGIDNDQYDSANKSFIVSGMTTKMNKDAEKFDIRRTPSLLVNEKYLVTLSSITTIDELQDLLVYLSKNP